MLGSDDQPLGSVKAVLFHTTEPRVVGVEVEPPAAFGVVTRTSRFVLLGDLAVSGDAFKIPWKKLPSATAGEKDLEFGWEQSVIWRNMPVVSAEGESVGVVHDAVFDAQTGAVSLLRVSTGMVGDAALGRLEVPGELVRGFDGEAVVVLPGYNQMRADGGAAKVMASGVAAVKVRGEKVGEGALQVGVAAAGALGRSLKRGAGRKAIEKLKRLMGEDE